MFDRLRRRVLGPRRGLLRDPAILNDAGLSAPVGEVVQRAKGPDRGLGLNPGDPHYRAYVGPPEDYDLIGAIQFGLLFAAGLRETHKLADIGCGSLRAGRLLIPYLAPGCYFGIEPKRWLVEEAVERELGAAILQLKRPSFSFADDFSLIRFGVAFDFVMAHSIFSHMYPDLTSSAVRQIAFALAPGGVLFGTFVEGEGPGEGSGWLYPGCVSYPWRHLCSLVEDAGLVAYPVNWPHPRQRWFLAGRAPDAAGLAALAARIQPPVAGACARESHEEASDGSVSLRINSYGRQLTNPEIRARAHRDFVGGMWDEIGVLQIEFLRSRGLLPTHRVLDVGCGALRGGIPLIRYLEPGHYYGTDVNASLIRAGSQEIGEAQLLGRAPTLIVDGKFDFQSLGVPFDFALAHSVFTHLPVNHIERCLKNAAGVLKPGARLFATYFEAPTAHYTEDLHHPGGVVTHSDADPYHYHFSVFEFLVTHLPLRVRNIGAWNHPRSQHMLEFIRD